MSEDALAQRRHNLYEWRERGHLWRGYSESQAIRQLIRQWTFDPAPKLSARALARKLGVWPSYVRKVRDKALSQGDPVPAKQRVTWDDLARARYLTNLSRAREPGLFAPVRPVPRTNGPAHVSVEEYERQRHEADTAATLERLRKRLAAQASG